MYLFSNCAPLRFNFSLSKLDLIIKFKHNLMQLIWIEYMDRVKMSKTEEDKNKDMFYNQPLNMTEVGEKKCVRALMYKLIIPQCSAL